MTIYVDDAAIPARGRFWYHIMSDRDDNELHAFALRIGLAREWFHVDHYDVSAGKRLHAVRMGAKAITAAEMATIRRAKRGNR